MIIFTKREDGFREHQDGQDERDCIYSPVKHKDDLPGMQNSMKGVQQPSHIQRARTRWQQLAARIA